MVRKCYSKLPRNEMFENNLSMIEATNLDVSNLRILRHNPGVR